MMRRVRCLGLVLVVLASPALVSAESISVPPEPAPMLERHGWFLGASLGVGALDYSDGFVDDGATGAFFGARFGGMLGQRFGLSAEFWSDGHNADDLGDRALTQNTLGIAMTYWATPRLWLKLGLGSATLKEHLPGLELEYDGTALVTAAGYEILSRSRYSVDLSARLMSTSYDNGDFEPMRRNGLALNIGANWY